MTTSERRKCLERLAREHRWDLPTVVEEFVANHDFIQSAEQLEVILTIGGDIASLRGEALSIAILERLTTPPDPSARAYPENTSAVIAAIEDGLATELRRALGRRGVNLEEISDYHDGMTPLLLSLFQRDLQMARILVEAGADVHNRGRHGAAPIHLTIRGRGTKRLELLLDAGADPDCRDSQGRTPLMLAAQDDRNIDKVRVLLAADADLELSDDRGETAREIAKREGSTQIAALLEPGVSTSR